MCWPLFLILINIFCIMLDRYIELKFTYTIIIPANSCGSERIIIRRWQRNVGYNLTNAGLSCSKHITQATNQKQQLGHCLMIVILLAVHKRQSMALASTIVAVRDTLVIFHSDCTHLILQPSWKIFGRRTWYSIHRCMNNEDYECGWFHGNNDYASKF